MAAKQKLPNSTAGTCNVEHTTITVRLAKNAIEIILANTCFNSCSIVSLHNKNSRPTNFISQEKYSFSAI